MVKVNWSALTRAGVLGLLAACAEPMEAPERGEPGAAFSQGGLAASRWIARVPDTPARIELERATQSYRISFDGAALSRALPQHPLLRFQHGTIDPLETDPLELVPTALREISARESVSGRRAYLVQFIGQPIEAVQAHLRALGVALYTPFPDDAYIVHMDADTAREVRNLGFVRWVGPYYAGLKLNDEVAARAEAPAGKLDRYSILVMGDAARMQETVAREVENLGGSAWKRTTSHRMEVVLGDEALTKLAALPEVLYIDVAGDPEPDVDIAREIGGANRLESIRGYSGQGVRAEVFDSELRTTHADFQSNPPLIHGSIGSGTAHGTSTYGIVFGDGASLSQARGFLPNAEQPIFAWYPGLTDRMAHTAELVDPTGPYRAVFQSNSWGDALTTSYTSISAEIDEILFTQDILITQSQSNAGTRSSRPQAWAKNVVSIGGVQHFNTLDRADDQWNLSASIGPAADGRIKPDLWHFYDQTVAPTNASDTAHTQFGGTSGATPITAGHFGLFFQMWADGVFNGGPGQGRDVFNSRPHMTTAKALMINSAFQYTFSGTTHDKTRTHQGWGMADLGHLYDLAEGNAWSLPILIDESQVITPLAVHTYSTTVNGSSPLKATLVYADPPGTPGAAVHRVNDLSLRVTSPTGTIFWGNNGLLSNMWSTSGGTSNTIDTVENVFIESPAAGTWTIEVLADAIVQDSHVETAALDADYALVVSHLGGALVNHAPVLAPIGNRTVAEGATLSLTLSASDADGDPITFSATALPANASLNSTTGAFTFAPNSTQAGNYTITFTAADGRGGTDSETVTITVTDSGVNYATLPYSTGFESGTLDAFWTTAVSDPLGRVLVTNANAPRGNFHLTMDVNSTSGVFSTDEAQLHVNLSGHTNVELSFWWKEFSDEDNAEDGVFFSDNGGATFVRVLNLIGGTATYTQRTLDVDALAAANGLSLSSTFVIKFQQRDNFAIATDGFAFDDVSVVAIAGCTPIYTNTFESGAGGWAFNASGSTCTTGAWVVGNPEAVTNGGVVTQLEDDHTAAPGVNAFFTASNAGGAGVDDVDGGVCTGQSGVIDASAHTRVRLSLWYYHGQRDAGGDANDFFRIQLSNDGGATFATSLLSLGDATLNAAWTQLTLDVSNPGRMVIRVQASDGTAAGDLIEGGIDDVEVCVPQ